jgi:DNA repair protein RadC
MSSLESIIENNEVDADLPFMAIQYSNAIKAINQIQPKGNQMYIYKPEIIYHRMTVNEVKHITEPKEIADLFRSQISGPIEKVAVIFYLNCRNDIVDRILFSDMFCGTVDQCQLYPSQIFKMAILNNSSRIILAHNHPSGHLSPSKGDIEITKVIKDGGKLLGIDLLDHLIISEDGFYSFQEQGGI